ncbi:MAG: DUF4331 domain-containing protein [Caldilineaceae bacterium]
MNVNRSATLQNWLHRIANGVLAGAMIVGASLVSSTSTTQASSHREAPLIAQDAYADNTDTYAFISPTNPNNIVMVASWIPAEGPESGPNYYQWGRGVLYDINVDSDGDAKPDFVYTLSTHDKIVNGNTFLYNVGPIQADGTNLNEQQYYDVDEVTPNGTTKLVDDELVSPVNIGSKSTPNYADLNKQFIDTVTKNGDEIKIYAGPTDDAFWVDLQVFDLLTLRGQKAPVGYSTGNNVPVDSLAGLNVHSLVIEIPISRLVKNGDPVLGIWSTSRRPSMRVFKGIGGLGQIEDSGTPVQVSRLGMPLVNEVVIPLALKDAFNSLAPELDATLYTGGDSVAELLQNSVENPEIGRLLCSLYNVPLPGDANKDCNTERTSGGTLAGVRSGRGDIFDIFLRGMVLASPFTINTKKGPVTLPAGFRVNRPNNPAFAAFDGVLPSEMIRINTNIKGDLCSPTPSRLGVLGGDACGFPNGRRLTDDIVEIELAAVAGAAYKALDGRDASFSFNPALTSILNDNIDRNDIRFRANFPYMALAQSGQEHLHTNPVAPVPPNVATVARVTSKSDDAEEKRNGEVSRGSEDLDLGEDGQLVGMRFTGVEIPKNAIIVGAYLQFTAEESNHDAAYLKVSGEATDDAAAFKSNKHNLSNRSMTNARINFTAPVWDKGMQYWTPNVGSIVQEIVGRSGWTPGNDLVLFVTGNGERDALAYDEAPGKAPLLYVEYVLRGQGAAASEVSAADPMNDTTDVWSSSILAGGDVTIDTETVQEDAVPEPDDAVDGTTLSNKIFLPFTSR